MDFGIPRGPGINPCGCLKTKCTHFVPGSVIGTNNTKMNQVISLSLKYSQIDEQAGVCKGMELWNFIELEPLRQVRIRDFLEDVMSELAEN